MTLACCGANGIRLYLTFHVLIIVAWQRIFIKTGACMINAARKGLRKSWKCDFRAVQKLAQIR
ncbi:hypothetical protein T4E_11330 [Trichinella pseudospiralis]|uniref:Uncharacterized protein n=1 Tax=Trichinella pseudospiralis TaxID=6337 RepID=A0A0V0Y302_TRIPS|nr:hypothetical protein T4E_11330 [Trichinella pseudospiralis]